MLHGKPIINTILIPTSFFANRGNKEGISRPRAIFARETFYSALTRAPYYFGNKVKEIDET